MKYPRSWKGFLRCEEKVRYYWDGELIGEVRSRRAPGAATPGGMVTHKEWDATLPGEREPHGGYGLESQTLAIDYLIGVHFSRKPGAREARSQGSLACSPPYRKKGGVHHERLSLVRRADR